MAYFDDAKVGDKVYGFVFGKGKIVDIFPDSFYSLMVEFKNGYEVPYTADGIPGWGNFKKQTLFYRDDIDLSDKDFSPLTNVLSIKKIIKLREKGNLEVRVPSGIWKSIKKVDNDYVEEMLEKENLHLFREKKPKGKKKKKEKKKIEAKESTKSEKKDKVEIIQEIIKEEKAKNEERVENPEDKSKSEKKVDTKEDKKEAKKQTKKKKKSKKEK